MHYKVIPVINLYARNIECLSNVHVLYMYDVRPSCIYLHLIQQTYFLFGLQ